MSSRKISSLDWHEIGSRIRAERENKGLTQEELAGAIGLKHDSSINKIEKGQGISLSVLALMAGIFGRSIDWFLTGKYSGSVTYKVAEAPKEYEDARRMRLVREVKELARAADDDVIDALLRNVEIFKKVPKST